MKSLAFIALFSAFASSAHADPVNMVAFGDSISQGTNSVVLGSNPERSWATGTKVRSHLVKLAELGHDLTVINASVNGAESVDLLSELDSIGTFRPDYVTVEIGANDVCNGFHPGTADHVDQFLTKLVAINPAMQVTLVPIPRLLSLYEANVDRFHCRSRWTLFKICPVMLGRNLSYQDRADSQARIDQINDELGQVAARHPQVRFDRSIGDVAFGRDDIGTIDCFHPSVQGQQKLSDLTFGP